MLRTKSYGLRTVISDMRQEGSMKLLFPRSKDPTLQAVLVNTAGGVTGGDRFRVSAHVSPRDSLTFTTQAAERAYRASDHKSGRIRTEIEVAAGARMNWMPQETILFDGSDLDRRLHIRLAPDARLLMCEPLVFGRLEMGERLTAATYKDTIEIERDGAPLYMDRVQLHGALSDLMVKTAGGAAAMASLVYCAPDAEAALPVLRDILPATGGASLIKPDLLVMRLLASDSFVLRQTLMPILARLSGAALPRPWML